MSGNATNQDLTAFDGIISTTMAKVIPVADISGVDVLCDAGRFRFLIP